MLKKIALVVSLFLLTACGTSPEKAMYEQMEKAVVLEEVFAEQQPLIVDAEKREYTLFEEIISLGLAEEEEIKRLANEALLVVNERQSLLELENESIIAGYEQFKKITIDIPKLKNKETKMKAEAMMEAMERRYETYEELQLAYEQSLALDRKLYELLQDNQVTIAELQEQINAINEVYMKVKELKEQFNEETLVFNEQKKAFYQSTNLNVSYDR